MQQHLRPLGRWSLGFVAGFLVTTGLGGSGLAIVLGMVIMILVAAFIPFWHNET